MYKMSRDSSIDERELLKIYSILSNPTKRKIILILGKEKEASATELRKRLGISVGSLYYSLDDLLEYVTQNDSRKYMLTERGYFVYNFILREKEHLNQFFSSKEIHPKMQALIQFTERALMPYWIFLKISKNKYLEIFSAILSFLFIVFGLVFDKIGIILVSLKEISDAFVIIGNMLISSTLLIFIQFLVNIIVLLLVCLALSWLMGSRAFNLETLGGILISLIPLAIYPYVDIILKIYGVKYTVMGLATLGLSLRLLQLITIGFLAASLRVFEKISKERAFIISALIFYISLVVESLIS